MTSIGRLFNKVAVITGAGGGMGRAAALRFSKEGAKVVIADIDGEAMRETHGLIAEQGGEATAISADISQQVQVQRLMAEANESYGSLDIIYNNAGIGPPADAAVTELEESTWDLVMGVNLRGTFLCSKYGIPYLVANGGGSVINVASIAGMRANTLLPSTAYTVSKGGIVSLTRQMAADYADKQVRVNAICPGPINTPTLAPFFEDPEVERQFRERIPLGRMGEPSDVIHLALYLASDEASWMTGSIITIDGGITA